MHATAGNITTYAIKPQNQQQGPPPPAPPPARNMVQVQQRAFYPRIFFSRHAADDPVLEQWENEMLGQNQGGRSMLDIIRDGFGTPRFNINGGYVTDWSQAVAAELVTFMRASEEATRNPWYTYMTQMIET